MQMVAARRANYTQLAPCHSLVGQHRPLAAAGGKRSVHHLQRCAMEFSLPVSPHHCVLRRVRPAASSLTHQPRTVSTSMRATWEGVSRATIRLSPFVSPALVAANAYADSVCTRCASRVFAASASPMLASIARFLPVSPSTDGVGHCVNDAAPPTPPRGERGDAGALVMACSASSRVRAAWSGPRTRLRGEPAASTTVCRRGDGLPCPVRVRGEAAAARWDDTGRCGRRTVVP